MFGLNFGKGRSRKEETVKRNTAYTRSDSTDDVVKPIFEMIVSTTREIKSLATLRDTLLPKFMSGEIDVSDFDI